MDIEKESHHYEFLEESMTCDVLKMIFCTDSDVFKLKKKGCMFRMEYDIIHYKSSIKT